jgi:hypothetical protein
MYLCCQLLAELSDQSGGKKSAAAEKVLFATLIFCIKCSAIISKKNVILQKKPNIFSLGRVYGHSCWII